jgi:protein-disulfide isomerase
MTAGQSVDVIIFFMDENEVNLENELNGEKGPEIVPAAPRPARPRSSVYPSPASSRDQFLWLALPLVFALGLGSGWFIWGNSAGQPAAQVTITDQTTRHDIPVDDDPSIGPADAPVTVIEFSDYQCPFCIRWHDTVESRLLADYAGKIRFVYRDLPLSAIHPEAQGAAEAADCAGEQNVYWQYHDALFGAKHGLGAQAYVQYASDLNLDMQAFNTCVAEHRYKNEVDADANFAIGQGLNATPNFYINGINIIGAQPYEVFQQIIDKELAGNPPK